MGGRTRGINAGRLEEGGDQEQEVGVREEEKDLEDESLFVCCVRHFPYPSFEFRPVHRGGTHTPPPAHRVTALLCCRVLLTAQV